MSWPTQNDVAEASMKALQLSPKCFAHVCTPKEPEAWKKFGGYRGKCQVRLRDVDVLPNGQIVEYDAVIGSGRTFTEALWMAADFMAQRNAKEANGNRRQQALRDAGKA